MIFNFSRVNVIGAGRLGKVMAYLFSKYCPMKIIGVCNSSIESAQQAVKVIGQGQAFTNIANLPDADIYFLAVPDDKITVVAAELKASHDLKNKLVMHFSANLSTHALIELRSCDCFLASLHPMQSFSDFMSAIKNFNGTFCAIETENSAIHDYLVDLLLCMEAKPFAIAASSKVRYHVGAVMAANYLVTLASLSENQLIQAGIEKDVAIDIVIDLMQSVLNNLKKQKNCRHVLTGPIARGDVATITSHLNVLSDNSEARKLYQDLAKKTLDIALVDEKTYSELSQLFDLF